jgi:FkbM family methyltransferase
MNLPQWIALPYVRMELPGWGKVLAMAGVTGGPDVQARWSSAGTRTIRGKSHGYRMRLRLAQPLERRVYYLGRFQELYTEAFLKAAMRPGDTALDVGANMGMVTLLMSSLVGPNGRVFAFEPNPMEAARIKELIELNNLTNVHLHPMALGDQECEMTLRVIGDWSISGTLGQVSGKDEAEVSHSFNIPVRRADTLLPDVAGNVLIKIDVEGFECSVLRGMAGLIDRAKPALITEVEPELLPRGGGSVEELFSMLQSRGYRAYGVETRRHLLRHRLHLCPIESPAQLADARKGDSGGELTWRNVAWIHPYSAFAARLLGN